MSDRTDLNNEEEVRRLFVRDLKMRSFGRQVDYILNQMMEKYNNPPEDGEISVSYYGYLFLETVTYLKDMGFRIHTIDIHETGIPKNVIYIAPTVVLSEEEIIESLRQSRIATIERNMAENEDDDFEEDEDLDEETEYKPFWKRFTDWLKSLGNKVLMRDEEDLEESDDFEDDYWEGDEEFDEEFDEDDFEDFEEDDPEECDPFDEDYL